MVVDQDDKMKQLGLCILQALLDLCLDFRLKFILHIKTIQIIDKASQTTLKRDLVLPISGGWNNISGTKNLSFVTVNSWKGTKFQIVIFLKKNHQRPNCPKTSRLLSCEHLLTFLSIV